MIRPLAYVAGPFNNPTPEGIALNRANAQECGLLLRELGVDVYVPHVASQGIETRMTEAQWIDDGLNWVRRCDLLVTTMPVGEACRVSRGTAGEVALARKLRIRVFDTDDLRPLTKWLNGWWEDQS
jgi:hypothetical protein